MSKIKKILMERDDMTEQEANDLIAEAKKDMNRRLVDGDMPYDICEEWFGLEPDYIDELVF